MTLHVEIPDEFWLQLEAAIPDRVRRDRFVARDLPGIKSVFRDWPNTYAAILVPSRTNPYLTSHIGNASIGGMFVVAGLLRSDASVEFVGVQVDEVGLMEPDGD